MVSILRNLVYRASIRDVSSALRASDHSIQ